MANKHLLNKRERVNTGGMALQLIALVAIVTFGVVIYQATKAGFNLEEFLTTTLADLFN